MSDVKLPRGPFENMHSIFLFLLLGYALYLSYLLAEPFLNTLVFSAVTGAVAYPVFSRLCIRFGNRTTAALVSTALVSLTLIVPMFFLVWGLAVQGAQALADFNIWAKNFNMDQFFGQAWLQASMAWISEKLPFVQFEEIDLQAKILAYSKNVAQYLLSFSRDILRDATNLFIKYILMVFVVFFFLRDGHIMVDRLKHLSPLKKEHEDVLLDSMQRISRIVFAGSLFVAVLQGIAGGIGFAIVGFPGFFWGTMMAFAALIPVVGTSLIWLPAIGWLLLAGQWGWGIFLAAWCLFIVVNIDTFLRPWILGGASKISPFYIFLAILGGVAAFGFKGILYGPLVLSFVMIMLDIYAEEFSAELQTGSNESKKKS